MGRIILITVYILLVGSSLYNLYSYKPDVGIGIKLSKGISESLQSYIVINNITEMPLKDLDIIINDKYYLHIYEIEENNNYNAFATEFIDIKRRPEKASDILMEKQKEKIKEIEEINKVFNKKIKVSVFRLGERYFQEL